MLSELSDRDDLDVEYNCRINNKVATVAPYPMSRMCRDALNIMIGNSRLVVRNDERTDGRSRATEAYDRTVLHQEKEKKGKRKGKKKNRG